MALGFFFVCNMQCLPRESVFLCLTLSQMIKKVLYYIVQAYKIREKVQDDFNILFDTKHVELFPFMSEYFL